MELGTYLPYLVNRVGQRFISDITPVLSEAGVDIQSWRVLIALYQRGAQTVGALSDLTSINFLDLVARPGPDGEERSRPPRPRCRRCTLLHRRTNS